MLSGASTFFVILTVNPSAISGLNTSLFEPDDQGCVMRKGIKADYVVAKKTKLMVYNVE